MSILYVTLQLVLMLALVILTFVADPESITSLQLPEWTRYLSRVLLFAGLILAAWARISLGRAFQVPPDPKLDVELQTGGIYQVLRHPMYTAVALIAIGLFLARPSIPMAAVGLFLVVVLLLKSRHEERLLLERYPAYESYRSRTRGVLILL